VTELHYLQDSDALFT